MTQESAGKLREIGVLVRADGVGEFRDGGKVTRMRASGPDELRGMLMERALQVAADEGVDVHVTTIDVDGVYDLLCTSDGQVDEVGDMRPLADGDTELTPEEAPATRQADGGYAALFGIDVDEPSTEVDAPSVPVHETERLPREAMMAKLDYDDVLRGEEVAQDEDEELSTSGLFDAESDPADADAADADAVVDAAEDDDADDDYHDEALDHDFDDVEDEVADEAAEEEVEDEDVADEPGADEPVADAAAADEPAEPGASEPADNADANADANAEAIAQTAQASSLPWKNHDLGAGDEGTDTGEWQPNFLRGRGGEQAPERGRRSPAAERAAQASRCRRSPRTARTLRACRRSTTSSPRSSRPASAPRKRGGARTCAARRAGSSSSARASASSSVATSSRQFSARSAARARSSS
jgi:hypothetical protein